MKKDKDIEKGIQRVVVAARETGIGMFDIEIVKSITEYEAPSFVKSKALDLVSEARARALKRAREEI